MTEQRFEKVVEWEGGGNPTLMFFFIFIVVFSLIILGNSLHLDYQVPPEERVNDVIGPSSLLIFFISAGALIFILPERKVYWRKIE